MIDYNEISKYFCLKKNYQKTFFIIFITKQTLVFAKIFIQAKKLFKETNRQLQKNYFV